MRRMLPSRQIGWISRFQEDRIDVPQLMRDQKLSAEVAARRARYQFYERVSERIGATKIAVGHHRGDQAETVLMNLLRGAGHIGLKRDASGAGWEVHSPLTRFFKKRD